MCHFCYYQIPDVHAKTPEASGLPAPITDSTGTGSGTSGGSGVGFKARPGSRSSPKTGLRLQNASKCGTATAMVADAAVLSKQNQSKEQAEKKNQAVNQLRRLLVQGNKRVEALATVIQHLFTEVLQSFYAHDCKKTPVLWFHTMFVCNIYIESVYIETAAVICLDDESDLSCDCTKGKTILPLLFLLSESFIVVIAVSVGASVGIHQICAVSVMFNLILLTDLPADLFRFNQFFFLKTTNIST